MTMYHREREVLKERYPCPLYKPNINVKYLPKSVDWRDHGYVTPVRQQVRYHKISVRG